jgi:chromate transporter
MAGDTDPHITLTKQTPTPAALALMFLKLGTVAFGGPAAHIAFMRQELVERLAWLSEPDFLDLLGAANLIPGPSSTELAIYIGFRTNGFAGLAIAGLCFIVPAALIVAAIAWVYCRYNALPQVAAIMYGVQPVVVAIVLQALYGLSRTCFRKRALLAVFVAGLLMAFLDVPQLLILLACGLCAMLITQRIALRPATSSFALLLAKPSFSGTPTAQSLLPLFLAFLKIGAIVFGSGYVLLAFLQADFVSRLHWLTDRQLLDAVAVGQVTPGPVFTTATFIGYLIAGVPGAAVATVAIFLPGFVFVACSGRFISRIRRSPWASAFLDGVTAASLALIAWVLFTLAHSAIVDIASAAMFLVAAIALLRLRINPAWLIAAGALAGLLAQRS